MILYDLDKVTKLNGQLRDQQKRLDNLSVKGNEMSIHCNMSVIGAQTLNSCEYKIIKMIVVASIERKIAEIILELKLLGVSNDNTN